MASDEGVHGVQDGRGVHGAEELAEDPRGGEIREEGNAATAVAGHGRTVETYEPPATASFLGRNRREQAVGVLVLEGNECEITVAIEPDGDPRRPAAELSPAVVQHDRPLQTRTFGHVVHDRRA